jgi:2-hydroxy-6-oxo-octa-2,4-dienoate hydrolase
MPDLLVDDHCLVELAAQVLMGTPAGEFDQTAASSRSWYYEPSLEAMREMLLDFPLDPAVVTDEMVRSRHEVTRLMGGLEAYRKLFPEPGKAGEVRKVRGIPEAELEKIAVPALVLHGRGDRRIPLECGLRIAVRCPNADLHVFSKCGHWVQLERRADFIAQVQTYLGDLKS